MRDSEGVVNTGQSPAAGRPVGQTALTPGAVEALRGRLRGRALGSDDDGYEAARKIWNGMIDRRPAAIVECAGTADVIAAVKFAREHHLRVSVRGGGHNVSGSAVCDGGLVIDLSEMRSVRIDPERRVARVAGGARLGDIDHEAQAFGLATPIGVVSATGIAGLTLHGGLGFLTRKYGTSSDNLIGADVVTADGQLLVVNEKTHPDLLWALRGGGGNFGVVCSFEFRLHPVGPDVWMAIVMYPVDRAAKVLDFFRTFVANAPDELTPIAIFWNAPLEEPIPEEHRGSPVIVLAACYCGPVEEGERAIQPLREIGTPVADLSGRMPYLMAQKLFDAEYPNGRRYYWKSIHLEELGKDVVQALAGHAARRPSSLSSIDIWGLGGALARTRPDATAFAARTAPFLLGIEANWDDPAADEANIAWAREVFRDMQRFSRGTMYLNFPGFAEEGEDLLRKSYGNNYERLQLVKGKYDPDNFFRQNLNIRAERQAI